MATAQAKRVANQVDMVWDVWLNNFKTAHTFQDDLQQKALQAFSYQKELLDLSVKSLNTIEEESKKASNDWNEKIQNNVKQSSNKEDQQLSKWLSNIQDVTENVQSMSLKPSRIMLDLLIESQNQFEETMKKTLDSQKQERAENLERIEKLIEQTKATQKEIFNSSKA